MKRAMSDTSLAFGSPRTRLVISFSLVLNLIQPSLAQQLSDKPEHGCAYENIHKHWGKQTGKELIRAGQREPRQDK